MKYGREKSQAVKKKLVHKKRGNKVYPSSIIKMKYTVPIFEGIEHL